MEEQMTKSQIQTLALDVSRPFIDEIVREVVPSTKRRSEARQVGALGCLVALETYEPGVTSFHTHAAPYVRRELARWRAACQS
jgi:DNA-directed RNA polymerase specialized sigma subunit